MLPGFVTLRIQSYQDSKNQTINIVAPAQDLRGLANASLFIDTIILRFFAPSVILVPKILIAVLYAQYSKTRQLLKTGQIRNIQVKITAIVLTIGGLNVLFFLPKYV